MARAEVPEKRWVIPALIGYSFSEAPVVTALTAVMAVLAGAAPVGLTSAIGELVDGLTPAIGQGLGTAAARECYRLVALVVVLFFLTHLAESARTSLGLALGRRVTGRGDETIDMPTGEAVFGLSTRASMWVTSIGSAALLARVTAGLGLIVFAVFVVIHSRLVRNYRIAAGSSRLAPTTRSVRPTNSTPSCSACRLGTSSNQMHRTGSAKRGRMGPLSWRLFSRGKKLFRTGSVSHLVTITTRSSGLPCRTYPDKSTKINPGSN